MTLQEAENAIVEEFSMYEEWLDKYEYLIELGKSLNDYPESAKTDDRLIKGCQSRVWLDYRVEDGRVVFNADSDAIITKGIISLLMLCFLGIAWGQIPVNPANLRGKHSRALVSASGPAANLGLSLLFSILAVAGAIGEINPFAGNMLFFGAIINMVLALFNLLPISGFDGGRVLSALLAPRLCAAVCKRVCDACAYFCLLLLFSLSACLLLRYGESMLLAVLCASLFARLFLL